MTRTGREPGTRENAQEGFSAARQHVVFTLAVARIAAIVCVLQGIRLAYERPWDALEVAALAAIGATLLFVVTSWRGAHRWSLIVVLVLLVSQLGLLLFAVLRSGQFGSPRLLLVAIVVLSAATVLSAVLAGARILAPLNALLLLSSVAVALLIGELGLELLRGPKADTGPGLVWSGAMDTHPKLGYVHVPFSFMKTVYPDNPRGYFRYEKDQDPRERLWQLQVVRGSVAKLEFPPNDPEMVRIAITKANPDIDWHVQLNLPHLSVESSQAYTVSFRARADKARNIVVGFARTNEPPTNLGLYQKVELTPEWRDLKETFTATTSEANGRIHFNVAGSDIPVEVSMVRLHRLRDGQSIAPALSAERPFVRYDFNARGCRGPDYAIPPPDSTTRILTLGDSFTMGVGVHQEDTFASQLERALMSAAKGRSGGVRRRYEVINCGVSGYGTRQERLFYQLIGAAYKPHVVLVVMVWNDDLSYLEEVEKGYIERRPGEMEKLFHLSNQLQKYRHQRRSFDYSKSVRELLQLDQEVRQQGARLAVILYRMSAGGQDNERQLIDAVTKGLRGTEIPILDLGPVLMSKHKYEDLIVHKVDEHPNEIAHKAAAEATLSFLRSTGLLQSN